MKTKIIALSAAFLLTFSFGSSLKAHTANSPATKPELSEAEIAVRIEQMRRRVEQIRTIDKSTLTKEERQTLKNELKEMNKQARAWGSGGVYLSVGAIIIIILILILIL
jgi:CHASE3 domain sensor protein